jgi:hypothetical protein
MLGGVGLGPDSAIPRWSPKQHTGPATFRSKLLTFEFKTNARFELGHCSRKQGNINRPVPS